MTMKKRNQFLQPTICALKEAPFHPFFNKRFLVKQLSRLANPIFLIPLIIIHPQPWRWQKTIKLRRENFNFLCIFEQTLLNPRAIKRSIEGDGEKKMSFETRSKKRSVCHVPESHKKQCSKQFYIGCEKFMKKFQTQRFIWRDSSDRSGVRRILNSQAQLCTPLLHWHLKSSLGKVYKAKCNKISPRKSAKKYEMKIYFFVPRTWSEVKGFHSTQ